MTVNMLIQIDKLVQLLESPVFTCKNLSSNRGTLLTVVTRPAHAAPGARAVPAPLQVHVRPAHAAASIVSVCSAQEPS